MNIYIYICAKPTSCKSVPGWPTIIYLSTYIILYPQMLMVKSRLNDELIMNQHDLKLSKVPVRRNCWLPPWTSQAQGLRPSCRPHSSAVSAEAPYSPIHILHIVHFEYNIYIYICLHLKNKYIQCIYIYSLEVIILEMGKSLYISLLLSLLSLFLSLLLLYVTVCVGLSNNGSCHREDSMTNRWMEWSTSTVCQTNP